MMPGYRKIRRTLVDDPKFGMLSPFSQHLYLMLLLVADDQGRLQGHPAWIRSRAFPYQDIALSDIQASLDELERAGLIQRYDASGMALIQIRGWWHETAMQWAQPSEYPAPEGWQDRVRYSRRGKIVQEGWDESGGAEQGRKPSRKPGRKPGRGQGSDQPRNPGSNPILKDQDQLNDDHDQDHDTPENDGGGTIQPTEDDIISIWEQGGKKVTAALRKRIHDAIVQHGPEWVHAAVEEAIDVDKLTWAYVKAILERWEREGYGTPPPWRRNGTSSAHDDLQRAADELAAIAAQLEV